MLKDTVSVSNKIIEENSPNPRKDTPARVQDACRTPYKKDQKANSQGCIIVITSKTQAKERVLKAIRDKDNLSEDPSIHVAVYTHL